MSVIAEDMDRKALENRAKWGSQDYVTLGLAIAEEAGELAQAVLQHRHEGQPEIRIAEEALDLGALCIQVVLLWHELMVARTLTDAKAATS